MPAGTASLLVATAPVYASLLAVAFLGERPGRRQWGGSAVALAGAALIAAAHGLGFGTSALIVLAAAVLQAIFHTAQKPLLARYSGFEVTAYAMWAGTAFILPWTGSLLRTLPQAGGAAIGSAVFLGVAPSAAGFVLWACHGPAGRRAGHPGPVPGPGGRGPHRAGLARPDSRPGRAGRRGGRPGRGDPGQQRAVPADGPAGSPEDGPADGPADGAAPASTAAEDLTRPGG